MYEPNNDEITWGDMFLGGPYQSKAKLDSSDIGSGTKRRSDGGESKDTG